MGHDARLSSPAIAEHLAKGFQAGGAHVKRMGLITSPISYFSTFTLPDVTGGIMVTGSHNPPEYNGFKVSYDRTTIHGPEIKSLEKIINARDYVDGAGTVEDIDILTPYVARYREEFAQLKDIPWCSIAGTAPPG